MKIQIDTTEGIIQTDDTSFLINDAIQATTIPLRYFGYLLNQDSNFSDEMKEEFKKIIYKAIDYMFLTNDQIKEKDLNSLEIIKHTKIEENK